MHANFEDDNDTVVMKSKVPVSTQQFDGIEGTGKSNKQPGKGLSFDVSWSEGMPIIPKYPPKKPEGVSVTYQDDGDDLNRNETENTLLHAQGSNRIEIEGEERIEDLGARAKEIQLLLQDSSTMTK